MAGHGGDNLDVTPVNLKGTIFQGHSGVQVKDGLSVGGFGFLMMTRADGQRGLDDPALRFGRHARDSSVNSRRAASSAFSRA